MTFPIKVVIVGAGVGGLATAYGLTYSKYADRFQVRILDYRQQEEGGAGAGGAVGERVSGNRGALDGFPIRLSKPGRQALSALLTPLDASLLTDARRRLPLKHDGISILHDSPSPSRWLRSRSKSKSGARLAFSGVCAPYESCMVERSDLVRILKEALRGRGVEVEGGCKVRGVRDGEGWWGCQRSKKWSKRRGGEEGKGGDGEGVRLDTNKEGVKCDFVVDGMFSTIRRSLYPDHAATAQPLGKVARNYRLTSPAIYEKWLKDPEGINVVLSGKGGPKWTATLIPTKLPSVTSTMDDFAGVVCQGGAKGGGDVQGYEVSSLDNEAGEVKPTGAGEMKEGTKGGGEVYCVLTTNKGMSDGLEGLVGRFIEDLKRDPGFAGCAVTAPGPPATAMEPTGTTATGNPPTSDMTKGKGGEKDHPKSRIVSISVQSVLSTPIDSARPLISPTSPRWAEIAKTPGSAALSEAEDLEPTSLLDALRASRIPSLPPTPASHVSQAAPASPRSFAGSAQTLVEGKPASTSTAKQNTTYAEQGGPIITPLYTCKRTYSGTPRVALIGDAAHGMTPFAGTGASLALRDAEDLVRVLERRVEMRAAAEAERADLEQQAAKGAERKSMRQVGGMTDVLRSLGGLGNNEKGSRCSVVVRPDRPDPQLVPEKRSSKDPAVNRPLNPKTQAKINKSQAKAEKAIKKEMYLFNIRMKRAADPAIVASRTSLWMAMGESAVARGTRGMMFGLGRAVGAGKDKRE